MRVSELHSISALERRSKPQSPLRWQLQQNAKWRAAIGVSSQWRDNVHARPSRNENSWCQRRDSNSQTPVSKTGRYSNSRTLALWCTGEDLNLRVPLGETGLQPVRFS